MAGSIKAVSGLPGSGKTYFCVRRLYKMRQRNPDLVVASNVASLQFPLGPSCCYVDSMESALEYSNCVMFLDELHLWFNARSFSRHGEKYSEWCSQLRKQNVDLYYTQQHIKFSETLIRRVTDTFIQCTSLFKLGWFYYRVWTDEECKGHCKGPFPYPFNPIIAGSYDTNELIGSQGRA